MDNTITERRIIEKSGRERLSHSINYYGSSKRLTRN